MSARDGESLETLARVKRQEERAAAEVFRLATQRFDTEIERLETLKQYAEDYRSAAFAQTTTFTRLRDGRQFMLQLEHTIDSQAAIVDRERRNAEAARAHWIAVRVQREAIDKLLERRADEAELIERRAEQRLADEFASRRVVAR